MVGQKKTPAAEATASEGKSEATQLPENDSTAPRTRQQRWRRRNPRSYLAHITVRNALRLGVLTSAPCEVCGSNESEAHHPDYDRPLDVVWLCRAHHRARHRDT